METPSLDHDSASADTQREPTSPEATSGYWVRHEAGWRYELEDGAWIHLDDERQKLYERINQRVDMMIEAGLLEEARWLYEQAPTSQVSKGIGYNELFPYFEGQMSLEEAVDKLKQNTRRFAKRQLTWFRNRMSVTFYQVGNPDYKNQVMEDIRNFLDK